MSRVAEMSLGGASASAPAPAPTAPSETPYPRKMLITPRRGAPNALRTPISRVFSTTIMKNVARMPKPATAMIKNNKMLRIVVSICTAANNGPCISFHV